LKIHEYNEMMAYLTRPRQRYENGGPVIPEAKPSPEEIKKIQWNNKLKLLKKARDGMGRRDWLNLVSEHLNDGVEEEIITREEFNTAISPLFGQAGEGQTRALEQDDSIPVKDLLEIQGETREDYPPYLLAEGGRAGFSGGSSLEEDYYGKQKLDWMKNYPDLSWEEYLRYKSSGSFAGGGRIVPQLVKPTIDGSRPGYQGEEFSLEKNLSKVPPKIRERFIKVNNYLKKIIPELNAGEKYVTKEQVSAMVEKKFNIKPKYKTIASSEKGFPSDKKLYTKKVNQFEPKSYPVMRNLDSVETKIENTLKNMLIENKPLNNFWYKALQERTGLNERTIYDRINDSPTYRVIKDQGALSLKDRFNKSNTHKFLKNLSFSGQLTQALEMEKGMPRFTGMGKLAGGNYALSPKFKAMEFAKRNWHANRGKGLIKFFDKNGKRIDWAYGVELPYKDVSFSYGGKRHNIEKLNDVQYLKKHFPNVYETQTAINNLRTTEIDDPLKKGKKITLEDLVKRNQVNTYKWGAGTSTFDILHGKKGVTGDPFTNLNFNTRDVNQLEMGINQSKTLSQTQKNNLIKSINKLAGSGDPEAIIKRQVALTGDIKSGKITSYEDMKNLVLKKLGNKVTNSQAGFIANELLGDIAKVGGKVLKGAGVVGGALEPAFAAMNFSEAIDAGLSGKEAGLYTVGKFGEDVINIPGILIGAKNYLKDKFAGQGEKAGPFDYLPTKPKFETPYDATFARDWFKKRVDATPDDVKQRRVAERDFDTTVLPNMTMVDDIDIPASKEEIETAKETFLEERGIKKPLFGKYANQIKDIKIP